MARMSVADQIAAAFASDAFASAIASGIERHVAHALTPLEERLVKVEADLLSLTSHVRTVAPFAKAPAKAGKGARKGTKSAKAADKPAASVADVTLPATLAALAGSGYDADKWALVRDAMREAGVPKSDANKAAAAFLRSKAGAPKASKSASERPAASVASAPRKAGTGERKESFLAHVLSPEMIEPKAQARVVIARKTPNPVACVKAWLAATEDRGALPEGDDDRLSPNTVAQYRAIAKRALEILA